jgi:HPt (histidine-containing phosphotransfer) domain-containing protein
MDSVIAGIHREFREGLPDRLERIRVALARLRDGYDVEAAAMVYRTAHSLKGTAPSFGAHGLVGPATALADLGRRWCEGGAVAAEELRVAWQELDRLSAAVERLADEAEGGGAR